MLILASAFAANVEQQGQKPKTKKNIAKHFLQICWSHSALPIQESPINMHSLIRLKAECKRKVLVEDYVLELFARLC